jgi:hypothetical protein
MCASDQRLMPEYDADCLAFFSYQKVLNPPCSAPLLT